MNPINFAAVPDSILPSADATYNLGSPSFEWNNIYAKTSIQITGVGVAIAKFGGTGADGALTITSGTTNISASSAAVLIKNYTSVSITGTAYVQFTTPNTNGTVMHHANRRAMLPSLHLQHRCSTLQEWEPQGARPYRRLPAGQTGNARNQWRRHLERHRRRRRSIAILWCGPAALFQ